MSILPLCSALTNSGCCPLVAGPGSQSYAAGPCQDSWAGSRNTSNIIFRPQSFERF